ncbi:GNAT family N-acetyltransferase [Sandarakinorhabdus sp.]|jgi:GNAT superfamily N-acetyltransferase|uniref:GNAT family N-acetyltransferase n=1 Tax=Sandarakinorhabdus sp. TaxID=1916663 RepID=UPI0033410C11
MIIRNATPADVPQILQFAKDLAVYEREPDAVSASEADLHAGLFGPNPLVEALIAEIDGVAVGSAIFYRTFSTWTGKPGFWLDDLYVRPEARGAGAGKALLVRIAALAAERGYARFEWWVLDWNEPAIGFYKKLGAKPMDEWTVMRVEGDAIAALAAT